MAQEPSSNWKKLQAKIKAESSSKTVNPPTKRKTETATQSQPKRQRLDREQPQKVVKPSRVSGRAEAAGSRPMGTTQSSIVSKGTAATIQPSLALWAADNDISPQSLAEAYGLGTKQNAMLNSEPPRVNAGLTPGLELGKYVGLDCEMVGVGPDGHDSVLARVSLVDFHGRQVYDSYVRPKERVTDWRTHITGITPKHMAVARDFDAVQQEVAELLSGRILVGHDIRHDLGVLMLPHPTNNIRDTARFSGFRQYGHGPKPALRVLAREILQVEIQNGHHSSIEDAKVAMLLFRRRKSEFDMENANKFDRVQGALTKDKPKSQPGKKKRKKH